MDIHSDAFIMFMYNTDHQRSSSLTFQHFFVVCLASCVCAHLFCIRRNQFPYINSSCLPLVAEHYIVIQSYLWCWFLAWPGPARPGPALPLVQSFVVISLVLFFSMLWFSQCFIKIYICIQILPWICYNINKRRSGVQVY